MPTRLLTDELRRAAPGRPSAFTIGTFDGVHRGHQFLIHLLQRRARERGLATGVLTLHPHPRTVVRPGTQVTYLTSLDERIELLRALDVNRVGTLTFSSEVSQVSAADFLQQLVEELELRYLLVGPDGSVGRGREGSGEKLVELAASQGVEVEFAPFEIGNGHKIGTTEIHEALEAGDIERVNFLLGRRYSLRGPVVLGDQRGRTIGFPTANVAVAPDRAIPGFGVYAACARLGDQVYAAAVNIGVRPTFGVNAPSIEAHLLDFASDAYGRELRLDLIRRLRGEARFTGIDELKAQIALDVAAARASADCTSDTG